ncbi:hypothetical protein [Thalassospira xiamenensis]|uniref:Uncharacterized protein n=1 Tax=Thalassospira xiamenensis TaxID=220697 RepID=A0A285T1G8_9PROT|nr:hypothetical protein [Thalassospira xiamenensis]SOC15147.1 hypothetical protein SAMN05428964_10267 [Thalassospira xiamenensis]
MKRTYLSIVGLMLLFIATGPALADWQDQQDAIHQLWDARAPVGHTQNFPANQCDNWAALPQNVQAVSTQTGSGLVVPSVSAANNALTDGLRQMAQSLHAYNTALTNVGTFYPAEVDGPFLMDAAYWQGAGRSPHGNALDHLPQINLAGLDNNTCPAGLANMNRQQVMDALNQTNNISNSQRWHCYSNRFSTVGQDHIPLTGYVEFTQQEYNGYAYAAADGRIVYDYVNNLVYFTPAHYRQWKKADFAQDMTGNYGCTPGGTCCDPFFKIVP